MLDGNEIRISVKKKRWEAADRLTKAKKRAKREVIEVGWLAVDAFNTSEECTDIKVQYAAEAFVAS